MLFNSLEFLLFFPVVCVVYYLLPWLRVRNFFLLCACWLFYAWWNTPFLGLLVLETVVAFFAAGRRGLSFAAGIVSLLAPLAFFKLTALSGIEDFLIPVGISFYTFQSISYLVDVRRGLIKPEVNFLNFALYMSFFPQLVAGPIERAGDLLPQFCRLHRFSHSGFLSGLRLMVWGFFLKLALADRCALYVDAVYNNLEMHNGASCLLAALLFSFQIYGDFAGYSLIAVGTARILGFSLTRNFRLPYLSSSVTEFWNRWHITLSRWMRDYVYIPLGGNRNGHTSLNLMLTMLVSGLWHGAEWSFIIWGGLHGAALCAERNVKCFDAPRFVKVLLTFTFVSFAWIFFRAANTTEAFEILEKISDGFTELPYLAVADLLAVMMALGVMWAGINFVRLLPDAQSTAIGRGCNLLVMSLMVGYIVLFGVLDGESFIYFAF